MAVLRGSSYAYSRVENVDPEETQHRRAQFLIYKAMQRADHAGRRRRPSWLRVKIFRLRIKIGKRFKTLTRGLFSTKTDFYKQVAFVLKSCKGLLHAKQTAATHVIRTLPSVS